MTDNEENGTELGSCGEAYLEETKLVHSPGADMGERCRALGDQEAVTEVHGSLDGVMVHLLWKSG